MTAMLEKVARAIYPKIARAADFNAQGIDAFDTAVAEASRVGMTDPWVDSAYEAARAALQAIREPRVEMLKATSALTRQSAGTANVARAYTTIIDAILEGKA